MHFNRVKENEDPKFENKSKLTENTESPAFFISVMQLGTIAVGLDILCFSASGATPITNIIVGYSTQVITQVSTAIIAYSISTMTSISTNIIYSGSSLVLDHAGAVKGSIILALPTISAVASVSDFIGLSDFKNSFPGIFISSQDAAFLVLEAFGEVKGSLLLAGAYVMYNGIMDDMEPEFTGDSPFYDS